MSENFRSKVSFAAILTAVLCLSAPARAAVTTLSVADGWNAPSSATLSSLNQAALLNVSDNNPDVTVFAGKTMSGRNWTGIYFNTFSFPANSTVNSVVITLRCRAQNNKDFYCDVSGNKAATKWSNASVSDESGTDVHVGTITSSASAYKDYTYDASSVITSTTQVNNMEILIRDDAAANDLLVSYVKVDVTYTVVPIPNPVITSAETVDDDLDGKIDAYRLAFSTTVQDSTLNVSGFSVAGRTLLPFFSTGTSHRADIANNNQIYLQFSEGSTGDTSSTPDLTYNSAAGGLLGTSGQPLLDVASGGVTEIDRAAPQILSATASDESGGGAGIQAGDVVQLIFSENTNSPVITKTNIASVLTLSAGTWLDGFGNIGSASWLQPNILSVTLSNDGGTPSIVVNTAIITCDSTTIRDLNQNASSGSVLVTGNFGADSTPPVIASRETADLDRDGYLDAVRIVFNKKVNDATVFASDFDVAGVTGESFSSTTNGDTSNNNTLYLRFTDGILKTDQTPNLSYTKGTLADLNANKLESSPYTVCSDKAPPAILSAVADDGTSLVPGVDKDDSVTLTFSEKTTAPSIDKSNIDDILTLSSGKTWKSGSGLISGASWNSPDNNKLVISLKVSGGAPTVTVGSDITVNGTLISDLVGNAATGTVTITGTFTGTDAAPPSLLSITPEDNSTGVAVEIKIRVKFSEDMDEASVLSAVKLVCTLNNAGETMNDVTVPGTAVFSSGNNTLTFTPANPLDKGFSYKVTVAASATDTIGNPLSSAQSSRFYTVIDSKQSNTVVAVDGKSKVVLPENTKEAAASVRINLDPVSSPENVTTGSIAAANTKLDMGPDKFNHLINGSMREITLYGADGAALSGNLDAPAQIVIPYTATNGLVNGSNPPVPESALAMHYLDEKHGLWVKLPESFVNTEDQTVSARVLHFSVYALLGVGSADISGVYAFPVPFKGGRDSAVTFAGLSIQATITIYTLNGERVRKIEHLGGTLENWDTKNDDGTNAADGVYLYSVENSASKKVGKLVIMR